ncbi:MAG: SpoIIE family protein phosphatase [Candidatus Aegiribacteria sp.]|nr:SpoIIE family protein phosphatase [Candidatus Aegiribacteria sp.]MBD3294324.1 SpoIIE family protein phosphatase [Candidatus Fermentibacteria bacterium]
MAALLLFVPLFFLKTIHGAMDFPETAACLGTVFFYLLFARVFSRLNLISVLYSTVLFTLAILFLSMYITPSTASMAEPAGSKDQVAGGSSLQSHPDTSEESTSPGFSRIRSAIDSLATSGGQAIRDTGLFQGSGTVGMTLGAVGEVTSTTAEIFIRTVYSGSNVAQEDSTLLTSEVLTSCRHPLKITALVFAVLLSAAILALLRFLVMVERRKGTLTMFRILIVTLVLRVLYVSLGLEDLIRTAISDLGKTDVILSLSPLYVFLMIFALINAFRTQWLHYLNRTRKYLALGGSLGIIFLSQSVLRIYYDGGLTVTSLTLGTFIGSVFTVLFIFSTVAFVKILFLLPSARLVDRKLNQLRIMDGLGQSIYSTFDENLIIEHSINLGRRFSGADRCWAVRLSGRQYSPWGDSGSESGEWSFPRTWHDEVIKRLKEYDGALLYNRYPRTSLVDFANSDSPLPGSLAASLIRIRKKTFGIFYAATDDQYGFMNETRDLLETFTRQVAAAVDNARLIEMELEKERYREELAIASSIQQSLLPGELPSIRGVDVYGKSVPTREIGGDYYDVIPLSDGLYGIAIADVAGKGAAASLLMAGLQSALQATALIVSRNTTETVTSLNRVMSERMPEDKFITFFYGILDPARSELTYCCAGHDPPLVIRRSGEIQRLEEGGLVLGVVPQAEYVAARVSFNPGDRLLLYTDGVTETMREGTEEEFGTEELCGLLRSDRSATSAETVDRILEELDRYRGSTEAMDDITLLLAAFTERS